MEDEFTVIVGSGLTTTAIVPVPTQPFASVTEIEYVPDAPAVTGLILGFCALEVKPFGPVQDQDTPLLLLKFSDAPTHTGVLLLIEGVKLVFTTTVVVAVEVHPFAVTVTV